jgi:hypothetical protein
MSFNVTVNFGAASATLHALSRASLEQSPGHSAAETSAALGDDVPPCGTPTPGHPPIPHGLASLLDQVALNPQPLPPKEAIGAVLHGAKTAAYDDGGWCGTVPRPLPFPPLPPGPWANVVSAATGISR